MAGSARRGGSTAGTSSAKGIPVSLGFVVLAALFFLVLMRHAFGSISLSESAGVH